MRKFTTELRAIDPQDGEIKTWQGPHIESVSFDEARRYCDSNGLGYLKIAGVLVAEVELDGTIINYDLSEN